MKIERTKEPFYTKIDSDVLESFREACKRSGINMNVIIETFMKQYGNDEFCFKIAENFQQKLRIRPQNSEPENIFD